MPIVDLQRAFRELGRLRMGIKVPVVKDGAPVMRQGKAVTAPRKLARWRLTTAWRHLLDAAVELGLGGEVRAWSPDGDRQEFELLTDVKELDILIPPGEVLDQWLELWGGGGCIRRCDGRTMVIDNGRRTDRACKCPADPDERRAAAGANPPTACRETTRLLVMLPGLPDIGVWRLESHGYYAAAELSGAATLVELASRRGVMLPAKLGIEARKRKVPGEPVRKFAVPVISTPDHSLGVVLAALGFGATGTDLVLAAGTTTPGRALPTPDDLVAPTPAALDAGIETQRPDRTAGGTPDLGDNAAPFDPERPTFEDATIPDTNLDEPLDVDSTEAVDILPPAGTPDPEPFLPPAHDPDVEVEGEGRAYTPAQVVAMRARKYDIGDDLRHAVIAVVTRGRASSGKDLDGPKEVDRVLGVLDRIGAGDITYGQHDDGTYELRQPRATTEDIVVAKVGPDGTVTIVTEAAPAKAKRARKK